MDLTLREGVDLQSVIHTAREIDQQSRQAGFNQEALDQMARQGFANAKFEMDIEEGLGMLDEFYSEKNQEASNEQANPITTAKYKIMKHKLSKGASFMEDMHKGLQESVREMIKD